MRIDGKCGKITKLVTTKKGRNAVKSIMVKLDGGKTVEVGLGLLAAPKSFYKLSSSQMKKILDKPFHGRKVGQKVCISEVEPLYGD